MSKVFHGAVERCETRGPYTVAITATTPTAPRPGATAGGESDPALVGTTAIVTVDKSLLLPDTQEVTTGVLWTTVVKVPTGVDQECDVIESVALSNIYGGGEA